MSFEHPEPTVISTEVSEDAQSVSSSMSVGPFGVYDPDKQLSDGEIIALKDTLKVDDDGEIIGRVCAHIVVNMLSEPRDDWQLIGEEGRYRNEEEYARHTGMLAVHWALGLKEAIDLPGAEWVAGMTPPATFAEALKEVEGLDFRGRKIDG